jgi:polyglycine hydrolase-like protein
MRWLVAVAGAIFLAMGAVAQAQTATYAAIWVQQASPDFVARHGLTAAAYQQQFEFWTGQGWCLSEVSGYEEGGQARYAAIWEKKDCPPFVARHGLTAAAYQQEFNTWTGQGYCLVDVSGYSVGAEARYAAIWKKQDCPPYVARHGLTAAAYQQQFDTWTGQGYRPKLVDGYNVQGQDFYAAIFEKSSGPAWVARHGLSPAAYQQQFNLWVGQGYRLAWVSGY